MSTFFASTLIALTGVLALAGNVSLRAETSIPLKEFKFSNISLVTSSSIDVLFKKGNTAHSEARYQRAEQYWRQIIEEFSPNSGAWIGLGHALDAQGYLQDSEAAYRKAIEINPNDSAAHESLGDILVKQDRESESLKYYDKAIQIDSNRISAIVGRGNALYYLGKTDEAIQVYRQAIKLRPGYGYAYVVLGNALKYEGKLDEASQAYQYATKISSQYTYAFIKLGQVLSEQERLSEALVAYNQAKQASSVCNTELFYALGDTYLKQAKFQEAQQAYIEASECGISILDKRFLSVGLTLIALRDSVVSVRTESNGQVVKKSVCDLRSPDNSTNSSDCSDSFITTNDEEPVFRELVNSIFPLPKTTLASNERGTEAFINLKALDLNKFRLKANQESSSADALASFGIALVMAGKNDEAISYLEKAIVLDPKIESVGYLATLLTAGGKRQTVLEVIDRSTLKTPDASQVYIAIMGHLNSLNRPKEAKLIFDYACSKYPNNHILLLVQVFVLFSNRDHSSAQKMIDRLRHTADGTDKRSLSAFTEYLTQVNQRLANSPKGQNFTQEMLKLAKEQMSQVDSSTRSSRLSKRMFEIFNDLAASPDGITQDQLYQKFAALIEQETVFTDALRDDPKLAERLKAQVRSYFAIHSSGGSVDPQRLQEILISDPQNLVANILKASGGLNRQEPQIAFDTLQKLRNWQHTERNGLGGIISKSIEIAVNRIDRGAKLSPFKEGGIENSGARRSVVAILPGSETSSDTDAAKSAKCGAGVVISRQDNVIYILTARHVLTNQRSSCKLTSEYKVEFYSKPSSGQQRLRLYAEVIPETLQSSRFPEDLAVLRVVGGVPKDVKPFDLAISFPNNGDALSLIGHPGNEEWKETPAILKSSSQQLLAKLKVSLPEYLELQQVLGYSGGAILDSNQKLVGVFTNTSLGGSAYSFNSIRNLAQELKLLP